MVLDESPTTHRNLTDKARETIGSWVSREKLVQKSFSCNQDVICGARQTTPRLQGKSNPQPTQRHTTVGQVHSVELHSQAHWSSSQTTAVTNEYIVIIQHGRMFEDRKFRVNKLYIQYAQAFSCAINFYLFLCSNKDSTFSRLTNHIKSVPVLIAAICLPWHHYD